MVHLKRMNFLHVSNRWGQCLYRTIEIIKHGGAEAMSRAAQVVKWLMWYERRQPDCLVVAIANTGFFKNRPFKMGNSHDANCKFQAPQRYLFQPTLNSGGVQGNTNESCACVFVERAEAIMHFFAHLEVLDPLDINCATSFCWLPRSQ